MVTLTDAITTHELKFDPETPPQYDGTSLAVKRNICFTDCCLWDQALGSHKVSLPQPRLRRQE